VIRGPFAELELKLNEEEENKEEVRLVEPMEVDEDFDIKCRICPKVNSEYGFRMFREVIKELPDNNREKYTKMLSPISNEERKDEKNKYQFF
jgi:hypothetical protein